MIKNLLLTERMKLLWWNTVCWWRWKGIHLSQNFLKFCYLKIFVNFYLYYRFFDSPNLNFYNFFFKVINSTFYKNILITFLNEKSEISFKKNVFGQIFEAYFACIIVLDWQPENYLNMFFFNNVSQFW